jgi:hypothetical protein
LKIIQINVSKQKLTAKSDFSLVAGTVGQYGVHVEYDSEWDELPYRLLMIKGSKTLKVRDDGEVIVIPPECIEKPCYLQFGLIGMDGSGEVRITTYSDSMENTFTVHSSDWKGDSTEDIIGPPSPTIWESLARDIDLLGNEILVCKQDIITNNQQISLLFEMIENLPSGGTGGNITVDSELSTESTNPVQNRVVAQKFGELDKDIEELIRKVEEGNVTSEEISTALGYTPANQEDVGRLSEEIGNISEDLAQLKQQGIIIVQNGSTLTFDNGGDE